MQAFKTNSNIEKILNKKYTQVDNVLGTEKIKTFVVPDFITLGKITALRFIEWAQQNPGGTVSFPTGKSPKSFIQELQNFLENWYSKETAQELKSWEIDCTKKPDLSQMIFVQMDEYATLKPNEEKSLIHFVRENYIKKLGFDEDKALLIDTSKILDLNNFVKDYEEKIKQLGGIGFFLGGIGPDGHIAFNFKGTPHNLPTHIDTINYESAAAAAAGFGGINNIRGKEIITIGLGTITQNPTTTAIILADGLSKAKICQQAIESEESVNYPATALQKLDNSRFYLTHASASELANQKYYLFKQMPEQINEWGTQILIEVANQKNKRFKDLTAEDIAEHKLGSLILNDNKILNKLVEAAESKIKQKIESSLLDHSGKTFLHTSPHHDDVLLGYFPLVQHLVKNQTNNYFATMTGGSNSVTNEYLLEYLEKSATTSAQLEQIKHELATNPKSQQILDLKGKIRDEEEEMVWKSIGIDKTHVISMKLGFYHDKTGQINFERDVKPVINLLNKIKPDVVTVASEPEGAGHDTHTKVYKIVLEAVKHYNEQNKDAKIEIWGYRNVWCTFKPSQADFYYPVNEDDFTALKNIFNACYKSQINAWLPSPEHDGPFCDFAEIIMRQQFEIIKTCVGQDYFDKHENQKIRNARGFCFIKLIGA